MDAGLETGHIWVKIPRADGAAGFTNWPVVRKQRSNEATCTRQPGSEHSGIDAEFIRKLITETNEVELGPPG